MFNSAQLQQRANAQYQRMQAETASPGQLILMLYQGCIRFIGRARLALQSGDHEAARINLLKAQDIVAELTGSLNLEAGGEIATNLFRLYEYLHGRLIDANIKRDDQAAAEVEGLLRSLLLAWEEAVRQEFAGQTTKPNTAATYVSSQHHSLGA